MFFVLGREVIVVKIWAAGADRPVNHKHALDVVTVKFVGNQWLRIFSRKHAETYRRQQNPTYPGNANEDGIPEQLTCTCAL